MYIIPYNLSHIHIYIYMYIYIQIYIYIYILKSYLAQNKILKWLQFICRTKCVFQLTFNNNNNNNNKNTKMKKTALGEMYVYMYVCMYVGRQVGRYVCMQVCMFVQIHMIFVDTVEYKNMFDIKIDQHKIFIPTEYNFTIFFEIDVLPNHSLY